MESAPILQQLDNYDQHVLTLQKLVYDQLLQASPLSPAPAVTLITPGQVTPLGLSAPSSSTGHMPASKHIGMDAMSQIRALQVEMKQLPGGGKGCADC